MKLTSTQRMKKACGFEPLDRPPVWMMRQAGRTLSEYRKMREKYSFWQLCKTPELAAEVTLQPMRRFPLDAAVIFSDILVIPDALGQEVQYTPTMALSPPIASIEDIRGLESGGLEKKLAYVPRAIEQVRKELGPDRAVLGFSGAPFTLACYMVEGGSSKHFLKIREMMYHHPEYFREMMKTLSTAVSDYLRMQADASVTAVQLFDTWAGELGPADYENFVLPFLQEIIASLKATGVPVIYYINGIGNLLEFVGQTGADVVGVDWRITLKEVRKRLGSETVVQGNLDPALLFASGQDIRRRVNEMIAMTGGMGHIVNLGHGLIPQTPVSGIETFVDTVVGWKNGMERTASSGR